MKRANWKRIVMVALTAIACAWPMAASADGPRRNLERGVIVDVPGADVVLYEVTEKMYLIDAAGNVVMDPAQAVVRKADASLFGWARLGSLLCPSTVLLTNPWAKTCSITADGIDSISLATGRGTVDGTFAVVVQDDNLTDAPEFVVMNGGFGGDMDLSIRPLGKIGGSFTAFGAAPVPFCGTFRLPFAVDWGKKVNPRRGTASYYLADDGQSLISVQPRETALGMPLVRLEVKIGSTCS
jgi:hypothetical protein